MTTYQKPTVLVDRDHNQLEVETVQDSLFIRTVFSPQLTWELDAEQVRRLRAVCDAFLAGQT